jgi:hypothetical protein
MRNGELIANSAASTWVSIARLSPIHPSLSALGRCMRVFRVLAVIAIGLASFAHEAAAQEPVHRIAILASVPVPELDQVFRDALRARGYDVGRNLQIEYRYFQVQFDRVPALVAELVALHPDIRHRATVRCGIDRGTGK